MTFTAGDLGANHLGHTVTINGAVRPKNWLSKKAAKAWREATRPRPSGFYSAIALATPPETPTILASADRVTVTGPLRGLAFEKVQTQHENPQGMEFDEVVSTELYVVADVGGITYHVPPTALATVKGS
jgi:hypothetical protein